MKLRIVLLLFALLGASTLVTAQSQAPVEQPRLVAGDRWTFRKLDLWSGREVQRMKYEITAVGDSQATIAATRMDAESEPAGTETVDLRTWTLASSQAKGSPSATDLAFPLAVGKKWTSEFTASLAPGTPEVPHSRTAQVQGWESVTVPAGTFQALRITYVDRVRLYVFDGIFFGEIQRTVWYAPAAKRYVKRQDVSRNPRGQIDTQLLEELVDLGIAAP